MTPEIEVTRSEADDHDLYVIRWRGVHLGMVKFERDKRLLTLSYDVSMTDRDKNLVHAIAAFLP